MRTAYGYQKNGGMQKYCVVPSQLVHLVPPTMSLKQAVFCQPLSTIVRGWDNMGNVNSDAKILIAGAGVYCVEILFNCIIDTHDSMGSGRYMRNARNNATIYVW